MPTNADEMTITPPFGYGEIAPLQKLDKVLLPSPGSTPDFCRNVNALAVSASEFTVAGRDYPLVFSSADDGVSFAPVAVLGISNSQNLFVDGSGTWEKNCYVPAFVRRYPFCISKLFVDGQAQTERLVCVVKAYLDAGGVALFDAAGQATAQWQSIERLLQGYEDDLDATAQMCAMLAKLDLFAPFKFEVVREQKAMLTVQGMYRIDETKLTALKPPSLQALVTKGLMSRVYAHLHSLERFGDLYARAEAQARLHTTATVNT
jgi:hypothetical protein